MCGVTEQSVEGINATLPDERGGQAPKPRSGAPNGAGLEGHDRPEHHDKCSQAKRRHRTDQDQTSTQNYTTLTDVIAPFGFLSSKLGT
jgi:hypothetical protein